MQPQRYSILNFDFTFSDIDVTNCPQGRQLAAISKQTTNVGKKEVQIESGVNNVCKFFLSKS